MASTRLRLLPAALLLAGCLSDATSENSQSIQLGKIDGTTLPVTITGTNSLSTQVTGGVLTLYTSRPSCDYRIDLSTGASIKGSTSCLIPFAEPLTNGIALELDLGTSPVASGTHRYEFYWRETACSCPKYCLCAADRSTPEEVRRLVTPSDDSLRLDKYRGGLINR